PSCSRPSSALLPRRPLTPTLFPYTTLFRSLEQRTPVQERRPAHQRGGGLLAHHAGRGRPRRGDRGGEHLRAGPRGRQRGLRRPADRKSTRLNSSHLGISYAVFCLKKKKREA